MTRQYLIYLDIDGVMAPLDHHQRVSHAYERLPYSQQKMTPFKLGLDPKMVEYMRVLHKHVPYKVVLSSSWRVMPGLHDEIFESWPDIPLLDPECKFERLNVTPYFTDDKPHLRAREIWTHYWEYIRHLLQSGCYDSVYFVVVDDENVFSGQKPNMPEVNIEPQHGITPQNLLEICTALTHQPATELARELGI